MFSHTLLCLALAGLAAAITYSPVQPPSYPLAVRNPYFSAWIPGGLVANLPTANPQWWFGNNLTWGVLGRVDGQTYSLFGVPTANAVAGSQAATVTAAEYTSTHSIFTLTAGHATFQLDFFSPVAPENYVRQSLPFSYLTVSVNVSQSSTVQVYTDIDSSWTGSANNVNYAFSTQGTTSAFNWTVNNSAFFSQSSNEMALWGQHVFGSRPMNGSSFTTQAGPMATVRGNFASNGNLTGARPTWTSGAVTALAHDLGTVTSPRAVTFAHGHVRHQAINYLGTPYTHYYRSKYPNSIDAAAFFLDDYADAQAQSLRLDALVVTQGVAAGGSNYSDILALSMRQAWGGLDLVIPWATMDTTKVVAFIKEISSDGNVNTVDVIMPAFPIYYVMAPDYIRLLLEPIMSYTQAGRWPNAWAIHDIGANYPNATGHDDGNAEQMPIEETGNMLIMAYAYELATGDCDWADGYKPVLQGWADYLAANSLNIANQLQTNDAAGGLPNETNLATKGAIGLAAFGTQFEMSNYTNVGYSNAYTLYEGGLATDTAKTHFVLDYPGNPTTWKLTFNLFADILLELNTFNSSAFAMECAYYPTIRQTAGVALDSRQNWGKTDWDVWTAGYCSGAVRQMFINDIWAFMSNGRNNFPFSDRYYTSGTNVGLQLNLKARPTVGGHFALLTLNGPSTLTGY